MIENPQFQQFQPFHRAIDTTIPIAKDATYECAEGLIDLTFILCGHNHYYSVVYLFTKGVAILMGN